MKIGLIDIDGHNFPNLALMKISAYHKAKGDRVSRYDIYNSYDIVYKSKVFTFTPDYNYPIKAKEIIVGGTGYNFTSTVPDEKIQPDYSIYPQYKAAYGFLTRGCIRKCSWCIVPQKEGYITPYMDIDEIATRKEVILMDNNVLAIDYGIDQIKKIATKNIRIDFNQGLDARLIDKQVAKLLSQVKWIRYIRLSCDSINNLPGIIKTIKKLNDEGIKNYRVFIYVLLINLDENYHILTEFKKLGVIPFAQPYISYGQKNIIPQWQKDMAQWVNKKSNFNSCDFKEYKPRKEFMCNQYFNINLQDI